MNNLELRQNIWDSIPFDVKSKKLSYSRIKDLLISVKEYINGVANPKEQTEAMKIGSLFELLLLQPEKFDELYFIKSEAPAFKSLADQKKEKVENPISVEDQKAAFEKIVAEAANGKTIIKSEMYAKVMKMVEAFIAHPLASDLISQVNVFQQKFDLEVDGIDITGFIDILCRAKEDIIVAGVPIIKKGWLYIVDIKKTNSVDYSNISKQVRDFKYYIQAFLYKKAIEVYVKQGKLALAPDQLEIPVYYIFQEDDRPYDTHVVNFGIMCDQMAKNEIIKAIGIFKTLLSEPENLFFGINAGVTTIDLPVWVEKEFREKEKHLSFTANSINNFQKFMVEKELDLTMIKPSVSVSLENAMNQIAQKKTELKSIDKNIEIAENPNAICTAYTSTELDLAPASDVVLTASSEAGKRKRRTKAEILAACLVAPDQPNEPIQSDSVADAPENIDVNNIFTAAMTAQIPEKKSQEHSIEFLIDYANTIKCFASGIYAVKKTALVLGFFKDMGLVNLNLLDETQRFLIYENLRLVSQLPATKFETIVGA